MRVIKLSSENVKRLKVVDITPDANFQPISGRNGSGKSSVLDSLFYALAGKEVIPGEPVRKGCERAKIRLNLGEIAVERKFSASGKTTVEVINEDGSVWKSPQTMLDALLGELTFDPLLFARSKPKEQFDQLKKISRLSIDIDAINTANAADYARRTDINREAKQKRAQAEAIAIPEATPSDPVSESDLLDGIEEAGKFNADIERRRANRERARGEVSANRRQAAELRGAGIEQVLQQSEDRIAHLKRQIAEIEDDRDTRVAKHNATAAAMGAEADRVERQLESAGALPDPISIADLRISLDAAKATNALIEKRRQRQAISIEAEQAEQVAQKLTERMAERDRQVAEAIKAANMPVPGLGFGADHVVFNGVPFDQASDAEQLRVSTAIAMAANPKLRIVRIKDGSLLDENGMKLIAEMAREKDFQVFIEIVDTSGKIGIFMEDGEVAAVNP